MNARRFLRKRERKAVEEAVAAAEERTAAEFVCAVATESGRYDRAESVVGICLALIALAIVYTASTWTPANSWAASHPVTLAELVLAVAIGFVVGAAVASYWHGLRRVFVPRAEIDEEVARAASHVFSVARLTSSRQHGGVLFYVSLFERRVVVLADTGAARVLGQDGIETLRDIATARLASGNRLATFTDAIAAAVEKLAPVLPPSGGGTDELPNAMLVFHPRP